MQKYYIDEFVNFDAPTKGRKIDMSAEVKEDNDELLYNEIPSRFSSRFEWDNCNESAFPILVWEKEGYPVAYWDCEYCSGYFV